jgi:hypothetical protein
MREIICLYTLRCMFSKSIERSPKMSDFDEVFGDVDFDEI